MNILWNPNEAVDILEMPLPIITEGTQDMGNGVYWLKAGTPLDEYFAVANDGDAKYVVAEDFYFISTKPEQAKVVQLITAGYVDINKAEAASGITYSQDCIDALADEGIVLVDGTLPSSGGGGGGGVLVVEYIQGDENAYINATAKELIDALGEGKLVFLKCNAAGSGLPIDIYERDFISLATKVVQTGECFFNSIAATPSTSSPSVAVTVWRAATENDKPVADYGE